MAGPKENCRTVRGCNPTTTSSCCLRSDSSRPDPPKALGDPTKASMAKGPSLALSSVFRHECFRISALNCTRHNYLGCKGTLATIEHAWMIYSPETKEVPLIRLLSSYGVLHELPCIGMIALMRSAGTWQRKEVLTDRRCTRHGHDNNRVWL